MMNIYLPSESLIEGNVTHVLVTHACPILRAGLFSILSAQPDFMVVASERSPSVFTRECVVVTDYAAGLQAASQNWPKKPGFAPRVLILTSHYKEGEIRRAIDSGVHGYLLLGSSPDELVKSVRLVGRGQDYLSPLASRCVIESMRREMLTRREHDVLQALARGGSDKSIARELGIGVGTVKTHLQHLMGKLGANARTHAVVEALRLGLLSDMPIETAVQAAATQQSRLQ